MIIYLATYPRSGNSLLQRVISSGLQRRTSQIKGGGSDPNYGARWEVKVPNGPIDWHEDVVWDERTAVYPLKGERYRLIMPGPIEYLTETRRKSFAKESNVFFLKLHDLPFSSYMEGEKVIQIVRHPGAVLWSYFRYLVDFTLAGNGDHIFERPPPTLDRVIDGEIPFGDWSSYHQAWESVTAPKLNIRFEDLASDAAGVIDAIGEFAGLEVRNREFPTFKEHADRFANADLRGTSEGYERFYATAQLEHLMARHGAMMTKLGYAPPELGLGFGSEQLRRMEAIMAVAWQWGQNFDRERKVAGERAARFHDRLRAMRERVKGPPG